MKETSLPEVVEGWRRQSEVERYQVECTLFLSWRGAWGCQSPRLG
jgi:hypothetical protein